jgi:hypothetical protein
MEESGGWRTNSALLLRSHLAVATQHPCGQGGDVQRTTIPRGNRGSKRHVPERISSGVRAGPQQQFNRPEAVMNRFTAFTGLVLFLFSSVGLADENPLLGTWKLKSLVREVLATGEKYKQFGEHPTGYISYSADGRMYAIGTADNRITPQDLLPTDEERVKLHQTMFAYAGTYSVEGEKVTHHVDISWNQVWNGTEQVRFYKLEGNTLTIKTAPAKSSLDGRVGQSVLVWEKIEAPTR